MAVNSQEFPNVIASEGPEIEPAPIQPVESFPQPIAEYPKLFMPLYEVEGQLYPFNLDISRIPHNEARERDCSFSPLEPLMNGGMESNEIL